MNRCFTAAFVAMALASWATPMAGQDVSDPAPALEIPRTQSDLPTWLLESSRSPASAARASYVVIYRYHERLAFYIPPRCCDIMSELYNELGVFICRPDGGIAGQGDGRCPAFRNSAERLATVRLD